MNSHLKEDLKEEILPIPKSEEVDQSEKIIPYLWEEVNENEFTDIIFKSNPEWHNEILDMLKNAENVIIIYTPYLIDPDIITTVKKKFKNGVRVYGLIEDIREFEKYLDFGIIRIKENIYSTYILVDPSEKPQGLWASDIISQKKPPETILFLNESQINELWKHFSYEFWKNKDIEYFLGAKDTTPPKLLGEPPEISEELNLTSRNLIFSSFTTANIDVIFVPEFVETPERYNSFELPLFASVLVVPFNELFRELIDQVKGSDEKKIFAKKHVKTGILKITNSETDLVEWYLYHWDIMLKLDENQVKLIEEKNTIIDTLTLRKDYKIGDITGKIIFWDKKWDFDNLYSLPDEQEYPLDNIQCENIDKWLNHNSLDKPKLPEELIPARRVVYTWKILPPYLSDSAQKHRLYALWQNFKKDITTECDKLQDRISKILKSIDENKNLKKRKNFKKDFEKIYKMLDNLKKQIENIEEKSISETKEIRDKLNDIIKEFNHVLSDLARIDEGSELSVFRKGYINKKKFEYSSKKIEVPPKTVPKIGVLYEAHNRNYLVIKYKEEIEIAKEEARNYNARIVVKKEN